MAQLGNLPLSFRKSFILVFESFKTVDLDFFDDRKCGFFRKYLRCMILTAFLIPVVVGQTLFIIISLKAGTHFLKIAKAIPTAMLLIQNIVKLTVLFLKKSQIRGIILDLVQLWPKIPNTEAYDIMIYWTRRLRNFNKVFLIYATTAIVLYEITPFLTVLHVKIAMPELKLYLLPYEMAYPWEINSILRYAVSYTLQCIPTSWINICLFVPCDLLMVVLTCYTSLLFRLLQLDLENVIRINTDDGISTTPEEYDKIRSIIVNHQKLIGLSTKLSEVFGVIMFVQISVSSIMICFFGFLTVAIGGSEMVKNALGVTGIMYGVFYNALPGQLLSDMSSGIADIAYETSWYIKDMKFRKLILIIIARAQRPCQLSALGFWKITLLTFSKVMSTSWSYLSLVNHIYSQNENVEVKHH